MTLFLILLRLGFFLTKIFHPNVAKNGAICVNTLKRDWKPDHGIKHILLVSVTVLCQFDRSSEPSSPIQGIPKSTFSKQPCAVLILLVCQQLILK